MDKNKVIIYQKDAVTIYWDKDRKRLYYRSPEHSAGINMYVVGNFDLTPDEYEAIMEFIGGRV